jgi:hypothetical protein
MLGSGAAPMMGIGYVAASVILGIAGTFLGISAARLAYAS